MLQSLSLASRRPARTFRTFAANDDGQALFDYALVSAVFAVFMIALLTGVQTNAGNNMTGTQAGLSNEAVSP
ncbi:MAG: hypothetical protein NVSMB5_08310 [Candidatus Velthaea sp.]